MGEVGETSGGTVNKDVGASKYTDIISEAIVNGAGPYPIKNDLTNLKYNSCDDVRQAIKAALDAQTQDLLNSDKTPDVGPSKQVVPKKAPKLDNKKQEKKEEPAPAKGSRPRKRPGAALPAISKRKRQNTITKMYWGKLANMVNFKRPRNTDSDEKPK